MKKTIISGIINGFKIIKDLGVIRPTNKNKYLLVECKECKREFETSATSINRIKSCGCIKYSQAEPLESEINGFKIIKDLGWIKEKKTRKAIVECKVCKREYEVAVRQLIHRKHCGCIIKGKVPSKYRKTHERLLHSYFHMRARCYNKNNKDYYLYGEKGIKVCDEWLAHPDVFCEWSLANGYQDSLTIDRINSKGDYEPNNCRWADAATQSRNTSRQVLTMELANQMRKDKEHMTSIELSLKYNVCIATVYNVINNKSWT